MSHGYGRITSGAFKYLRTIFKVSDKYLLEVSLVAANSNRCLRVPHV